MFLGWDIDDRDKALTWYLHELERCPSCGTRPEEWDPARGGDRNAYSAEVGHCRGCEVRAGVDEAFDRDRKRYRRGSSVRMRRRPRT